LDDQELETISNRHLVVCLLTRLTLQKISCEKHRLGTNVGSIEWIRQSENTSSKKI
jgi:hypothetical protein